MGKGRLEAFSDGVFAVIITIMVLELKRPAGAGLDALVSLLPSLATYVVSFLFVGIYWNNHHHLLHAAKQVDGRVLLANLHLLFWLSLVPFVTGWVGQDLSAALPTACYGVIFLAAGLGWLFLVRALVARNGADSVLARAIGRDLKGKASGLLYAAAVGLAFVRTWLADAVFLTVTLMWFIPDRRIEPLLEQRAQEPRR